MAFIKVRRSGPRQSRTAGRFLVIARCLCFGSPAGSQIGLRLVLEVLHYCRRYPASDGTAAALPAKEPRDQQGGANSHFRRAMLQNMLDHQADNHRAVGADLPGHLVRRKMAGKRTPTVGSWPVRGRPRFRLRFPIICVNTKTPNQLTATCRRHSRSCDVCGPRFLEKEVSPLSSNIWRA